MSCGWFVGMRRIATVLLLVLLATLTLVGCGSDGNDPPPGHFTPDATTTALEDAGWTVKSSKGGTVKDVIQTGFLELTSPAGTLIDVQFIDSDEAAEQEFEAAVKEISGFQGSVDRNAIIFIAPLGASAVPASDLDELLGLLT